MKNLFLFILIVFSTVCSQSVLAISCGLNFDNDAIRSFNASLGTVYVQRDAPIGSIIATTSVAVLPEGAYTCDQPWTLSYTLGLYKQESSFGDKIYNTDVPGVGIRIRTPSFVVPDSVNMAANVAVQPVIFIIELIKTETTVVQGSSAGGTIAFQWGTSSSGITPLTVITLTPSISIIPLACSINTPSLTFPIGNIPANIFGNGPGSTASGASNTQNLILNCDPQTNVTVMLEGGQNPDTTDNTVLALTGQGGSDVATGIGVQLIYNNSPMELNQRIVLKQSAGGQEIFPITARYVTTTTQVTAGKANASATLDLTYQ